MDEAAGVSIFFVFFAVTAVVGIGGLAFWVVALVECARTPEFTFRAIGGASRLSGGELTGVRVRGEGLDHASGCSTS